MSRIVSALRSAAELTSPAVWVLSCLAAISTAWVLARPAADEGKRAFWTFSRPHAPGYLPVIADWNAEYPDKQYKLLVLDYSAIERRMLSGFMSGTPLADLMEVERNIAARAFTGPLEEVGFVDLTDRLREEGLLESINAPSFNPWTSRGRIFGLPHDVHPVLLAYRADLVEEAGIDLSGVETWAEFFAALRPLMRDTDGDGRPDRYLINFWPTNSMSLEMLVLQADGALFDERERPSLSLERNAEVLATLATWCAGPARVAVDAPEFSAAGNALKLRGVVVSALMPDWQAGVWKSDMPSLAGRWRLMPLPAWERGGRRTSVQGGSMLGVPKATVDFESAWALAKRLYLDPARNADFFRQTHIIPPSRASWSHPVFDEPDPYFGGQPSGRLYIEQAPAIPRRSSSPYNTLALALLNDVLLALADRAGAQGLADPAALLPEARSRLAAAQARIERDIARNVFLRDQPRPPRP